MSRRTYAVTLTFLMAACTYSAIEIPHSSAGEVGVPIRGEASVRCGLDNAVFDLDGSLWVPATIPDADREGIPEGFTEYDVGTLTLLSDDEAEYRSSKGRVIPLTRLGGTFEVNSC
jgi:hypothetical protein